MGQDRISDNDDIIIDSQPIISNTTTTTDNNKKKNNSNDDDDYDYDFDAIKGEDKQDDDDEVYYDGIYNPIKECINAQTLAFHKVKDIKINEYINGKLGRLKGLSINTNNGVAYLTNDDFNNMCKIRKYMVSIIEGSSDDNNITPRTSMTINNDDDDNDSGGVLVVSKDITSTNNIPLLYNCIPDGFPINIAIIKVFGIYYEHHCDDIGIYLKDNIMKGILPHTVGYNNNILSLTWTLNTNNDSLQRIDNIIKFAYDKLYKSGLLDKAKNGESVEITFHHSFPINSDQGPAAAPTTHYRRLKVKLFMGFILDALKGYDLSIGVSSVNVDNNNNNNNNNNNQQQEQADAAAAAAAAAVAEGGGSVDDVVVVGRDSKKKNNDGGCDYDGIINKQKARRMPYYDMFHEYYELSDDDDILFGYNNNNEEEEEADVIINGHNNKNIDKMDDGHHKEEDGIGSIADNTNDDNNNDKREREYKKLLEENGKRLLLDELSLLYETIYATAYNGASYESNLYPMIVHHQDTIFIDPQCSIYHHNKSCIYPPDLFLDSSASDDDDGSSSGLSLTLFSNINNNHTTTSSSSLQQEGVPNNAINDLPFDTQALLDHPCFDKIQHFLSRRFITIEEDPPPQDLGGSSSSSRSSSSTTTTNPINFNDDEDDEDCLLRRRRCLHSIVIDDNVGDEPLERMLYLLKITIVEQERLSSTIIDDNTGYRKYGSVGIDLQTSLKQLSVYDPKSNPDGIVLFPTILPSHIQRLWQWFSDAIPVITSSSSSSTQKEEEEDDDNGQRWWRHSSRCHKPKTMSHNNNNMLYHLIHIDSEGDYYQLHVEDKGCLIIYAGVNDTLLTKFEKELDKYGLSGRDDLASIDRLGRYVMRKWTISRNDVIFAGDMAGCPFSHLSEKTRRGIPPNCTSKEWYNKYTLDGPRVYDTSSSDIGGWMQFVLSEPNDYIYCRGISYEEEERIMNNIPGTCGLKSVVLCALATETGLNGDAKKTRTQAGAGVAGSSTSSSSSSCLCEELFDKRWLNSRECTYAHPNLWHKFPQSHATCMKNLTTWRNHWCILYYAISDLVKARALSKYQEQLTIHKIQFTRQ